MAGILFESIRPWSASNLFGVADVGIKTYSYNECQSFGVDIPWDEKRYCAVIRRFANGQLEVCTSVVRAMEQWQRTDRWGRGGQVLPEDLTSKQRATIEAEKASYRARRAQRKAEQMEKLSDIDIERMESNARADSIERSIRRARQQVRWHCRMLAVDHLATLTYRENVEDVERLKRDWKEFVRRVRLVKPDWQFVAVRERQDRGALHLHVAVHGRQDLGLLRRCWYQALGGTGRESGEDTPGQIDVRGPSKRFGSRTQDWKINKLTGYMCKYMHKAFEELESKGAKRYWNSRGIEQPQVQRVWLASVDIIEAIKDTHGLLVAEVPRAQSLWASEGYDCVWMAG